MILALGVTTAVLFSGCTPTPTPRPSTSPSTSATPSATPTESPVAEPERAFDVSCVDADEVMTALTGQRDSPAEPVLSLASAPSWYPGPAQYMFQRGGGIACSVGDYVRGWELTLTPHAETVTAGAAERHGYDGESTTCYQGNCLLVVMEGDALLTARISDPAIGEADAGRLSEGLRALVARAADSLHETEIGDSEIASLPCERLLPAQMLADQVEADVQLSTQFDGWGIPAEIYHVVNGAEICYYADGDPFMGEWYLTITSLPGGAWAFDRLDGEPVAVDGADSALAGIDTYGRAVLDLRAGPDWIRLTTPQEKGVASAVAIAETVLKNIDGGVPAPQ